MLDVAHRLSARYGATPQFWMHLQADWDLHRAVGKIDAAWARDDAKSDIIGS